MIGCTFSISGWRLKLKPGGRRHRGHARQRHFGKIVLKGDAVLEARARFQNRSAIYKPPPMHQKSLMEEKHAHDPGEELIEATNEPLATSPAANRMRLHRQRRRMGLRCVVVELRETEIDALTRKGFLKADARNDPYTIREALVCAFRPHLK
jgi:hypothetical protein